jgi:23S rRNA maturation-related 3'-5' exoribonuclease YhaM
MENLIDIYRDSLLKTGREGMTELLSYLTEIGFLEAPASTRFHGAYEGALLEHSVNVLKCAEKLGVAWLGGEEYNKIHDSVVICSLLHDVGKCGQFGKPLYIPNILKSGKTSDAQPYATNPDLMTLPHEIVSVIEVTKFIDLTEDEQRAIAWHNGLYGTFKYDIQGKETSLYMIIHFADMWASRVIETVTKQDAE